MIAFVTGAVIGIAASSTTPPTISEIAADAASAIRLDENGLSGPGGALLYEALEDSTFLAIGEQHFIAESALLTTALFEHLANEEGYRYIALENGAMFMEMLGSAPLRGDLDAIIAAYQSSPFGAGFGSVEELRMIAAAGAASRGGDPVVWGLEHPTGATHLLARMHSLAVTQEEQEAVFGLLQSCSAHESKRLSTPMHFGASCLIDPEYAARVDGLDRFRRPEACEWNSIIDDLLDATAYYRESMRTRNDAGARQALNERRESDMRARLMRAIERAETETVDTVRVLVRAGALHLNRNSGPGGVGDSVGSMIASLAADRGSHSVHLMVVSHSVAGQLGNPGRPAYLADLLSGMPSDGWSLIDLEQVRMAVKKQASPHISADLARAIEGYDYVLCIPGATPVTWLGSADQ